jgi:hypothetical protein
MTARRAGPRTRLRRGRQDRHGAQGGPGGLPRRPVRGAVCRRGAHRRAALRHRGGPRPAPRAMPTVAARPRRRCLPASPARRCACSGVAAAPGRRSRGRCWRRRGCSVSALHAQRGPLASAGCSRASRRAGPASRCSGLSADSRSIARRPVPGAARRAPRWPCLPPSGCRRRRRRRAGRGRPALGSRTPLPHDCGAGICASASGEIASRFYGHPSRARCTLPP